MPPNNLEPKVPLNNHTGVKTVIATETVPEYHLIKETDLWHIHGKTYDLTSFLDSHPGGKKALMWAKGRDCTELYESYHTFTEKHRSVLKKYEVKNQSSEPWVTCFDWSKTEIYEEMRAEVVQVFKEKNIDFVCPTHRWFTIALFASVVVAVAFPYYRGEWWAAPLYPLVHWILGINVFHCASHFAMSHKPWVNTLGTYVFSYFSSPTTWAHQHVIGHHTHTNIHRKDPDLNHGIPFFRGHPRFKFRPHYTYQLGYVWFFWASTLFYLSILLDYFAFKEGGYYEVVPLMWLSIKERKWHVLGRVLSNGLIYGPLFVLFPFGKAVAFSLIFLSVFSICFMMTTQVNHLVPEAVTSRSNDWAVHQIMTSHNFCHDSWLWFFFTGGLNRQIEHHLFPGVNAHHLPLITPIVKKACKKYDIPYNYSASYAEAIGKYCKNMYNNSKPFKMTASGEKKTQ